MKRIMLVLLALVAVFAITGCGGGDEAVEASSFGSNDAPAPAEGVVQVALVWDEAVDVDLEVWDATGTTALVSSGMVNVDKMTKADGAEYIDFIDLGDYDLSTGDFVVSVYFAESEEVVSETNVKLIITDAEGDEDTVEGTVYWEPGQDQWHAFSIDAATGAYSMVDEYIEIEVTE